MIPEAFVPALAIGVKLRLDKVRGAWVLLAPERMFALDETSAEVLRLVDGRRTAAAIAEELAARFDAPREVILADVLALLRDLSEKGALRP